MVGAVQGTSAPAGKDKPMIDTITPETRDAHTEQPDIQDRKVPVTGGRPALAVRS